ncbi:MAG: nuclear transport factor 2 family protein [Acidimicrobiia bacterium]
MGSIEQNKELVRLFMDLLSSGEVDEAFTYLADDAEWFSLSSRTFNSKAVIRSRLQHVYDNMLRGPIVQTIIAITAEDDRVAVQSEGRAETVTGVRYDNLYHFLFQISGDRIGRLWEYTDTKLSHEVLVAPAAGALG